MQETKQRSPKAPSLSLENAIAEIQPVFDQETRNSMSREVLARHLGYTSISGASTAKIGALRHFGLIVGREDSLKVSDLAVELLMHGPSSNEFKSAARLAFESPSLYQEIHEHFDGRPSQANLEYWLVQRGAQKKSASKIASLFLDSADFAKIWESPVSFAVDAMNESPLAKKVKEVIDAKSFQEMSQSNPADEQQAQRKVASGLLSKETSFELLVKGPLTNKEIDMLIKKLQLDKEILTD